MGGGAPDVLYLGLDNSLASSSSTQSLCRLTFFAPYWVDNRTGLPLAFKDHASAPKSPILLGARIPFDTTSVRAPGQCNAHLACFPLTSHKCMPRVIWHMVSMHAVPLVPLPPASVVHQPHWS